MTTTISHKNKAPGPIAAIDMDLYMELIPTQVIRPPKRARTYAMSDEEIKDLVGIANLDDNNEPALLFPHNDAKMSEHGTVDVDSRKKQQKDDDMEFRAFWDKYKTRRHLTRHFAQPIQTSFWLNN